MEERDLSCAATRLGSWILAVHHGTKQCAGPAASKHQCFFLTVHVPQFSIAAMILQLNRAGIDQYNTLKQWPGACTNQLALELLNKLAPLNWQ
jgi:hypothetical protein